MMIRAYEPTITDPSNHLEVVIWDVESICGHMLQVIVQWGDEFKRIGLNSFGRSLTIDTQIDDGNGIIVTTVACIEEGI